MDERSIDGPDRRWFPVMIEAGTVLAGRYRVIRHLGTGGMASVWLAEDEVLRREVAVKRVHAAPESESGRRIMREARLGATLSHSAIVHVFDIVADGDALLLVMEYVAGETLGEALRRGPLTPARALAVLRPVADALDHVHARGIVHRDVKPANILLHDSGAVKLADLGVATSEEMTQITRTGGLLGTVAYMAPEQFEPGAVTPAADVYALASVAYEMLAGGRVHQAATPLELMSRIREAPLPDLAETRPGTPPEAAEALRQGLAREPGDRTKSAGELVAALEAAFAERPPEPEPTLEHRLPAPAADADEPTTADEPVMAPAAHDATAETTAGDVHAEEPVTAPAAVAAASPGGGERRRRGGLVAAAGLALLCAVVLAIVLGSVGDDDGGDADTTAGSRTTATTGTSTAPRQEPEKPPRADATPESAVRNFYTRAADGDYAGAYALAGPRFRAEFGSRAGLEDTLGSLRSIEFVRLEETQRSGRTATVALQTVAEHTTYTDRCTGTLQAVRRGEGWRVEPQGVRCRRDP